MTGTKGIKVSVLVRAALAVWLLAGNSHAAHLTYYGGKVISNVKLVFVLYGSGSFASYMTNDAPPSMASFYQQVVNSSYLAWLCEYSTPAQAIGVGSYAGKYQIIPAATNNTATIQDANIQAELAQQIQAGHLPAPDSNTLYMVHFPAGKVIAGPFGYGNSCQNFCSYHNTAIVGSYELYYVILPDFTGACSTGCGNTGTEFGNLCFEASHEMIESITDPEVGLDTGADYAYPCAWADNTYGEIADICDNNSGANAVLVGSDGQVYAIEKGFSNHANTCVAANPRPVANPQSLTNYENRSSSIALSGSDTNSFCPRPLSFAVTTSPAHGSLSGVAPNLVYNPTNGFVGQDFFQFTVNDGFENSSPAVVTVTLIASPLPGQSPILMGATKLASGPFGFFFTNNPGSPFTVLASTNLALPLTNWTVLGSLTDNGSGIYQFTDTQTFIQPTLFYRVRSP